jgi:hypothetical protein
MFDTVRIKPHILATVPCALSSSSSSSSLVTGASRAQSPVLRSSSLLVKGTENLFWG